MLCSILLTVISLTVFIKGLMLWKFRDVETEACAEHCAHVERALLVFIGSKPSTDQLPVLIMTLLSP